MGSRARNGQALVSFRARRQIPSRAERLDLSAATEEREGEVHEHWSFFSHDRARHTLVFRQFHQESLVNQYVMVAGSPAGTVVFESEALENVASGWRARETYQLVSPDEFVETLELASGAGAYEVYSKARFKRVRRP
jgi:hypothetical protein